MHIYDTRDPPTIQPRQRGRSLPHESSASDMNGQDAHFSRPYGTKMSSYVDLNNSASTAGVK